MPRTAELSRIPKTGDIGHGDRAPKESGQDSVDDDAIWIFGKKRSLIPAAVIFSDWRRRATPRRQRQRAR
jgi:hypothetical protein